MPAPKTSSGKGKVKVRVQVNLDPATLRILDRVSKDNPEVQGRSAAIRYLAYHHARSKAARSRRAGDVPGRGKPV